MSKKITLSEVPAETLQAAQEFIKLQNREIHPAGEFDNKKRFYLAETHDCCSGIRTPSAAWPFSQMTHGRTAEHVAHAHGVDASHVRRVAKILKKQSV